jgi:hypothetical protein
MTRAIGFLLAVKGPEMVEGADTLHPNQAESPDPSRPAREATKPMPSRSAIGPAIAIGLAGLCADVSQPVCAATCGMNEKQVANADVVFVGTMTAASSTGDRATFVVSEVWSARDLPAVVQVSSTAGQWSLAPPDAGAQQYVVLADAVDNSLVVRFECDVAQATLAFPWDPSYAAFRPATAHPPTESAEPQGMFPVQFLVIIGAAALIAAASALAFRRTRDPDAQGRPE